MPEPHPDLDQLLRDIPYFSPDDTALCHVLLWSVTTQKCVLHQQSELTSLSCHTLFVAMVEMCVYKQNLSLF
jgi:hypothetical protein